MSTDLVYQLERIAYPGLINPDWKVNYLLIRVKVSVNQRGGTSVTAPLLVDCGATFTSLSPKILETVGCDLSNPLKYVPILTGSGIENRIPVFQVPWLGYENHTKPNFPVLALDLPKRSPWRGVLGMDFLEQCHGVISFAEGKIRFGSM